VRTVGLGSGTVEPSVILPVTTSYDTDEYYKRTLFGQSNCDTAHNVRRVVL